MAVTSLWVVSARHSPPAKGPPRPSENLVFQIAGKPQDRRDAPQVVSSNVGKFGERTLLLRLSEPRNVPSVPRFPRPQISKLHEARGQIMPRKQPHSSQKTA